MYTSNARDTFSQVAWGIKLRVLQNHSQMAHYWLTSCLLCTNHKSQHTILVVVKIFGSPNLLIQKIITWYPNCIQKIQLRLSQLNLIKIKITCLIKNINLATHEHHINIKFNYFPNFNITQHNHNNK